MYRIEFLIQTLINFCFKTTTKIHVFLGKTSEDNKDTQKQLA